MTRIFIDITDMETHWDGTTGMRVLERDNLGGADMAIAFGDNEIVLTLTQAITLYEMLDGFINSTPARTAGEITKRVRGAVELITQENWENFSKLWTGRYSQDDFARQFTEMVKVQGLRFRLTGEEPALR